MTAAAAGAAEDVLHVVKVNVSGLTGITAVAKGGDDAAAATKKTKAVVAVMRDSKTYGISALSRNLVQSEQSNKHYIAVWKNNNNTHKNYDGDDADDSVISFETKISTAATNTNKRLHRNFDLIVGLATTQSHDTSKNDPTTNAAGATYSTSTSIAVLGAASLPLQDAARLASKNSNGKVVLDLPVFNVKSLPVDPFASLSAAAAASSTAAKNDKNGIPLAQTRSTSSLRQKLSLSRRRQDYFEENQSKTNNKPSYALDTARDAAILRVELEIRPVAITPVRKKKKARAVLVHSQHHAIETAHTVARSRSNEVVNNILYMEPSIEQVLSTDYPEAPSDATTSSSKKKSAAAQAPVVVTPPPKLMTPPTKIRSGSFRVRIVDQTTPDYELEAVRSSASSTQKVITPPTESSLGTVVEDDTMVHIMDAAIERVLSVNNEDNAEAADTAIEQVLSVNDEDNAEAVEAEDNAEAVEVAVDKDKMVTSLQEATKLIKGSPTTNDSEKKSPTNAATLSVSQEKPPAANPAQSADKQPKAVVTAQEPKQPRQRSRTLGSAIQAATEAESARQARDRKPPQHGPFGLMRLRELAEQKRKQQSDKEQQTSTSSSRKQSSSSTSPKSRASKPAVTPSETPMRRAPAEAKPTSSGMAKMKSSKKSPHLSGGKPLSKRQKIPVNAKTSSPKSTSTKRQAAEQAPSKSSREKNQASISAGTSSPKSALLKRTTGKAAIAKPPPSPKRAERFSQANNVGKAAELKIPAQTRPPPSPRPILKTTEATASSTAADQIPPRATDLVSRRMSTPSPVAIMIENVQNREPVTDWKLEGVVNYIPEKQKPRDKTAVAMLAPQVKITTSTTRPFSDARIVDKWKLAEMKKNKLLRDGEIAPDSERNVFSLIQPCGELEDILDNTEDEDTMADTYTQNDSITDYTDTTRRGSIKHDLTDLLMDGLCRARGCQVLDEDAYDDDTLTNNSRSQPRFNLPEGRRVLQHHWVEKLGAAVVKRLGDDFDDLESFGQSYSVETFSVGENHDDDDDESASTDTNDGDSFISEEVSQVSSNIENGSSDEIKEADEGTEIDVNEVQKTLAALGMANNTDVLVPRVKNPSIGTETALESTSDLLASKRPGKSPSIGSYGIFSGKEIARVKEKSPEPSVGEQSTPNTEAESKELSAMSSVQFATGEKTMPSGPERKNEDTALAKKMNDVSARYDDSYLKNLPGPGKKGKRKATHKGRYRPAVDDATGKDDPSPRNVMYPPVTSRTSHGNSKSLAKSLADIVARAMTPVPNESARKSKLTSSKSAVTHVPRMLEAYEVDSVGELTATTHEILVDIEEYKRQIGNLSKKGTKGNLKGSLTDEDKNYFSEYDQSSMLSPEVYAAEEAALAKRQAGDARYG